MIKKFLSVFVGTIAFISIIGVFTSLGFIYGLILSIEYNIDIVLMSIEMFILGIVISIVVIGVPCIIYIVGKSIVESFLGTGD